MKVSNHIHDDIAVFILSKLPLKSLKRFQCVNKSWSLLFDNPYFMTLYRNYLLTKDHSYYDDSSVVLVQTVPNDPPNNPTYYYNCKILLHSLSGEKCENVVQLDWPKPFQEDDPHPPPFEDYASSSEEEDDVVHAFFGVLSSVSINGTLCVKRVCWGETQLLLWNPTTKEFKFIPSSPIESKPYWRVSPDDGHVPVGYDRVTHEYKVIRFITCIPSRDLPSVSFLEMYIPNSNTWRIIDVDMLRSYDNVDVYMDGVCHWWAEKEAQTYLVSFDFSKESSITTLIPSQVDRFNLAWRYLVLLNGSIAFISAETSILHILMLGELGIKESWTKLFIVEFLPCLADPIGAGKKGRILFRKKDGELAWFDLSNKMIEEIGITTKPIFYKTIFHKENILPIGGINS